MRTWGIVPSGYHVANMVSVVVIYCFCLFKQKKVVRADVSINTNMYGLNRSGLREKKSQKKKTTIPLHLLLPCFSRKLCARRHKSVPEMTTTFTVLVGCGFGQLNMNTQAQSVRMDVDAQLL
jgi:hypothetical protein